MTIPKKYFHDHLVMLLLSVNAFLALGGAIFILISLSTGHSSSYIVQCRDCSNSLAINKFTNGTVTGLLSFVVFEALVLATHVILSLRAFPIHRQLSIAILSLGVLLLALTIIVSNSLLVLR